MVGDITIVFGALTGFFVALAAILTVYFGQNGIVGYLRNRSFIGHGNNKNIVPQGQDDGNEVHA